MIGTHLGPYEIVAKIGQGGMGEVYRARDVRLDRIVAIKVLSAALKSDEDFRNRFDREARAVAALTHPHICTLYDVGREGDVDYLVMDTSMVRRSPSCWPTARSSSRNGSAWRFKSRPLSKRPTTNTSFIAISSRATSSSPAAVWPRSSISDWPSGFCRRRSHR